MKTMPGKSIALAALCMSMAIVAPRVVAQETIPAAVADDPFDLGAFDSGVRDVVESEDRAETEYTVGGVFVPSLSVSASEAFGGYLASGSVSGKLLAKVATPSSGTLYASAGITQQFLQGRGGDVPAAAAAARNLYSPTLSLLEIHYSFDVDKAVFARLGNQLISWGPSKIWSVVDFINLQKADSFQSLDLRAGKPGLRLHVPFESSNLFGFADFSGSVRAGAVQDIAEATNYGVRLDAARGGFEFGLTGYFGPLIQGRGGLDFSGRLLGSTVYGEAALLPAYGGYGARWTASAGVERAVGESRNATLSAEFFYDSAGADDESGYPALVAAGSFVPNYTGKYHMYAGLAASDLLGPGLDTTLSLVSNLSDMSFSARFGQSFGLPGAPPFSLAASWTGGGPYKAYTYFAGDNALSLTLQTRIEF